VDGLHQSGADEKLIAALQIDLEKAELSSKEKALARLAEVLTTRPQSSRAAVRSAREAGWAREQVDDAIFLISYFNMRTRIMDAFDPPPDRFHPIRPGATLPLLRCTSEN